MLNVTETDLNKIRAMKVVADVEVNEESNELIVTTAKDMLSHPDLIGYLPQIRVSLMWYTPFVSNRSYWMWEGAQYLNREEKVLHPVMTLSSAPLWERSCIGDNWDDVTDAQDITEAVRRVLIILQTICPEYEDDEGREDWDEED